MAPPMSADADIARRLTDKIKMILFYIYAQRLESRQKKMLVGSNGIEDS